MEVTSAIGCLISHEKTEMAKEIIVFLGVLLNGKDRLLHIPVEKRSKH